MIRKTVKISTSFGHTFINDQINPALLKGFQFEIDNNCNNCDYWIVWGDLPVKTERMSVKCPLGNVIYMTDEAFIEKKFDPKFLNQFDAVITCRSDISHPNQIRTHEINQWHMNRTFTDVYNTTSVPKSKSISIISSDLTVLPGHKKRYAFVNKLIGHFKDRIDIYGRGFNPIANKWDALAPYKYSVAIENSSIPGYFTEKITECYLAHTFPIYFGAPDIETYFDSGSLLVIDVDDYKSAILSMEKLLEEDPWKSKEDLLIEQKKRYLSKYHLFPALSRILDFYKTAGQEKAHVHYIKSHRSYEKYFRLKKILRSVKSKFNNEA